MNIGNTVKQLEGLGFYPGSFLIRFWRWKMLNDAWVNLLGVALGVFGGIVASSRMTIYRLEQLEKKVDKHNSVIERTFKLEQCQALYDEKLKVANHRIDDLEER